MNDIQSIGDGLFSKPLVRDIVKFIEQLKDNSVDSNKILEYLKSEKNLTEETINNFKIGYDYYRNYITIPEIKNREVVNVAYRSLEKDTKEKYKKEKGCENWIFNESGIEEAKKKGGILIVSNQFDAMSAWQAGLKNVISIPYIKGNATGEWINLLENIPKVYISFENNKTMKRFGIDFADRLGTDRCFEIQLPDDIKDLNSFFKIKTYDDFRELVKNAKPFYKYTYEDLGSIIESIVSKGDTRLSIDIIPFVKIDVDYLFMVSGKSGAGKTTYVMNIADRFVNMNIPTMVVPYERGSRAVGEKYMQIRLGMTEDEVKDIGSRSDIDKIKEELSQIPLYFSKPEIPKMRQIVERAKKLFGVRVIVVDHLEYNVDTGFKGSSDADRLKAVMTEWKNICLDLGVIFFVVHHVKKTDNSSIKKELTMEDLLGGGTTYRVAEGVIMISNEEDGTMKVSLVKSNHSKKGYKLFEFNGETGKIGKEVSVDDDNLSTEKKAQLGFDKF